MTTRGIPDDSGESGRNNRSKLKRPQPPPDSETEVSSDEETRLLRQRYLAEEDLGCSDSDHFDLDSGAKPRRRNVNKIKESHNYSSSEEDDAPPPTKPPRLSSSPDSPPTGHVGVRKGSDRGKKRKAITADDAPSLGSAGTVGSKKKKSEFNQDPLEPKKASGKRGSKQERQSAVMADDVLSSRTTTAQTTTQTTTHTTPRTTNIPANTVGKKSRLGKKIICKTLAHGRIVERERVSWSISVDPERLHKFLAAAVVAMPTVGGLAFWVRRYIRHDAPSPSSSPGVAAGSTDDDIEDDTLTPVSRTPDTGEEDGIPVCELAMYGMGNCACLGRLETTSYCFDPNLEYDSQELFFGVEAKEIFKKVNYAKGSEMIYIERYHGRHQGDDSDNIYVIPFSSKNAVGANYAFAPLHCDMFTEEQISDLRRALNNFPIVIRLPASTFKAKLMEMFDLGGSERAQKISFQVYAIPNKPNLAMFRMTFVETPIAPINHYFRGRLNTGPQNNAFLTDKVTTFLDCATQAEDNADCRRPTAQHKLYESVFNLSQICEFVRSLTVPWIDLYCMQGADFCAKEADAIFVYFPFSPNDYHGSCVQYSLPSVLTPSAANETWTTNDKIIL